MIRLTTRKLLTKSILKSKHIPVYSKNIIKNHDGQIKNLQLDYKRLQDLHKSKQIIESQSCEIQKLEKQINIYIYHFPNFKRTRF